MKSVVNTSHAAELQREKGQIGALQKEIKESYLRNKIGLTKEILREEITKVVKDIWPYIKIVFDKKDLLEKAQQAVETISKELEDMPEIASNIIKFLNSKDIYELEELGINDRTTNILEVKKIITKKNLIIQLEEKCSTVNTIVQRLFSRLEPLNNKGLPSMIVINEKLMPIEDYVVKLTEMGMLLQFQIEEVKQHQGLC